MIARLEVSEEGIVDFSVRFLVGDIVQFGGCIVVPLFCLDCLKECFGERISVEPGYDLTKRLLACFRVNAQHTIPNLKLLHGDVAFVGLDIGPSGEAVGKPIL